MISDIDITDSSRIAVSLHLSVTLSVVIFCVILHDVGLRFMSDKLETHSEPRQTSKMKYFAKIVNGTKSLTTFSLDVIID